MYLPNEITEVLCNKLNFSSKQIEAASANVEVSSRVLGLVQILRDREVSRDEKRKALDSLRSIRSQLDGIGSAVDSLITRACNEYYTFKNYRPAFGFGLV